MDSAHRWLIIFTRSSPETRSGPNMTDALNPSAGELDSVRKSVEELRDSCWQKRMMLSEKAGRRERWQRALHLASGIVTLISGGSVAALIATISGAASLKLTGAVIAFCSGVISLVVTTYFDVKETQKMFVGASTYGILRDRLITLLDELPTINNKTSIERLAKIRADVGKAGQQYDSLLPTGKQLVAALIGLSTLLSRYPGLVTAAIPWDHEI
jgi:hypothetical protein